MSRLDPSFVDAVVRDAEARDASRRGREAASARSAARPSHVLYGGAHLWSSAAPAKLALLAKAAMDTYGRDDVAFARAVGVTDEAIAAELATRVRAKLARSPIEAMCIDFEDGYGPRPDAEEDDHAARAARELARLDASQEPRPLVGLRVKALDAANARRALRTLDVFLSTLAREADGRLPRGLTVTLPKITSAREVEAFVRALDVLEAGFTARGDASIGVELMVETPEALLDDEGRVGIPAFVRAAGSRCVAAHLGAYDLTSSLGVAAEAQRLDHPMCDLARITMNVVLEGTGIAVFDGATTTLPVPPHKAPEAGARGEAQREENARAVTRAWSAHAAAVSRAIDLGVYAGWDLHPAQLPARWGALYGFFLGARRAMAERLRGFVTKATQATLTGQAFDDAATGQGLLVFFLRGVACGALDEGDVVQTGLTVSEMQARSFSAIVAARAAHTREGSPAG